MNIKRLYEWAADIVVSHRCNRHCEFCCDKNVNKYNDVVKIEDVKRYLDWFRDGDAQLKKVNDIMILGGEPCLVGVKYIQEICDLIHSYETNGRRWKVSLTTNGVLGAKIGELDGYVDYLNVSVYDLDDLIVTGKADYRDMFTSGVTELVYAILIQKEWFPTQKSFDTFIDLAQGYDLKFSTFNAESPLELNPDWVFDFVKEHESEIVSIFETCKGMDYRDSVIKFMHLCDLKSQGFPKLYPNGVVNRTWNDEVPDMCSLEEYRSRQLM